MPTPDRQRHRALTQLAERPDGVPEALMLTQGFSIDVLVDLIRDGLATVTTERVVAPRGRKTEVTRWWITEAGRRVLAER
jgi:hypothetical protein